MARALRGMPTVLVGLLLIGVLFTAYTAQQSQAGHEPANKTAAAGSDVDEISPDGTEVVLEDTIRVASSQDAIISVTAECSILTSLLTGDDESPASAGDPPVPTNPVSDWAYSFGQVQLHVTIDGQTVPVSYTDAGNTDEPVGPGGEVVFCNRAYQRSVVDRNGLNTNDEGADEGDIDQESDYISTRTANAFNWLARDIGFNYDTDGDNVVVVQVHATYATETASKGGTGTQEGPCPTDPETEKTCAEAYVGSRTLIIEPTNVAIHEAVTNPDGEGN